MIWLADIDGAARERHCECCLWSGAAGGQVESVPRRTASASTGGAGRQQVSSRRRRRQHAGVGRRRMRALHAVVETSEARNPICCVREVCGESFKRSRSEAQYHTATLLASCGRARLLVRTGERRSVPSMHVSGARVDFGDCGREEKALE